MNRFDLARMAAGAALVACTALGVARADYRIGDPAVPSPLFRTATDFAVYAGHPRLYFRDTDLPAIRARIAGDFRSDWKDLRAVLERKVVSQPPQQFAGGSFLKNWELARGVAFVAAVTGEEKYVQWTRRWMQALVAVPPAKSDDELRGRLQCLAVAYDWLYDRWSEPEREQMRAAIIAHLDRGWRFATRDVNYVSGHSRFGNFALAAGLLAIVTERPELRERLLVVRHNWVDGYWPAQAWIANEGGYHMGWCYSAGYLTGDIHCIWSSATNECAYFPWEAKLPLFWIYGRQGDGYYPNTGDAYSATGDFGSLHAQLVAAEGVFKDRHARWLLPKREDRLFEILYGDSHVQPLAPDDRRAALPLSLWFGHAGVVLARDRWDAETTLLQFRSVPFYSENHHHRDENSFTIHYRGGLAIDSGLYDERGAQPGGYGGPHWLNYFTRTVAHNAILVYDPAQKFTNYSRPVTNDGGQPFRSVEPSRLEDLLPGGADHLDGVTYYQDAPGYTAMAGDATKAYDPARVRLAQRAIVYLRGASRAHPVVVVFDRVESAKPEFAKRFLLHTVNEPALHGNLMVAENRGGRLSCLTLLPADAKFAVIGGPGHEAWVDGANHPWAPGGRPRPGTEPGAWRLEVSPGQPRARDYFLHVLFVDEAGARPVTADDAKLAQTDDGVAVAVAGWRVAFPFAAGGAPRVAPVR
ncbi:MAG TPA: heparinase II/III family protein [Opitutus sp.]|nr:heparinase II/III family protein [Opitutus sp.]